MYGLAKYSSLLVASIEPETTAWVAAVIADGGSVSPGTQSLVNDLIAGLKAAGVWRKLDCLWLFAAENTQSALRDLKATLLATATNSPTFTTNRGYSGNVFDQYVATPFNPSSASSPNYVRDSACAFGWNDLFGSDLGPLFGTSSGTQTRLYPNYAGAPGRTYWTVNNSGGNFSTPAEAGYLGLWAANRSGASANELYRNAVNLATNTDASEAITSWTLLALAEPSVAAAGWRISCLGAGGSLDSTEHTALYNRLRTYMSAVGVP